MTPNIGMGLRRDRIILIAGLVAMSVVAWAYVINLSFRMTGAGINDASDMASAQMAMPNITAWQTEDVLFTFLMWTIMMVAMMIPSAMPMILAFAGLIRQGRANEHPIFTTITFLLGYLVVWLSFSMGATLIQCGFHSAGWLSESINATPLLSGVLFIFAGVYQLTPLKYVCLSNCRTPLRFLLTEWRDGIKGALIMGMRHGLYCLGCCWPLMLLLFAAGVMNLLWVVFIAVYVMLEKAMPAGLLISRVAGLFVIGWGTWLLIQI